MALWLALYGWWAYSATAHESATFDEPLHLVGGYAYSAAADFRLHPENGVLPQRWAGLALSVEAPALPSAGYEADWRVSDIARLSTAFLYDVGNDPRSILSAGRRAALLWSLALGVLVFAWAWSLWGTSGAFLALALYSLSPTFLAHGALVTSDVCGSLFIVLSCWAWWRHLERLDAGTLLLSATAAGLAAIAKFSAAVLPPLFVVLAIWKLWLSPSWTLHVGRKRELSSFGSRAAWILAAALVHAVVAAFIIWAAFDFRFAAVGPGMPEMAQYYRPWSDALPHPGLLRSTLVAMRDWQLLPEAYIYGFGHVLRFAEGRSAFLNGEYGAGGWWWFFPYAFVVKSSLAELCAVGATLVLALVAWRARRGPLRAWLSGGVNQLVPLVTLAGVYLAFSVTSNLNIGHRHLIPLYPVLFIASGALVLPGAARWRRAAAFGIVLLGAVESLAVRPHYLAFFNATVGGPSQGWRHLVDSSLDWGQDLPALAGWLRAERRSDEALYYNIFGQRRAAAYGVEGIEIAPGFAERDRPWVDWGPGLYVVSATILQDVYSPFAGSWDRQKEANFQVLSREARDQRARATTPTMIGMSPVVGSNYYTLERLQFARLLNYLRLRSPDAVLGYSIFVHRLSEQEVRVITEGDSPQYLALLESAK